MGYFAYAFSHSAIKSVLAAQYGYLGLIPNLAATLAAFVNIESAPLVTTYCALLIQFVVSAYIFFCDSVYWDTFLKKVVIASSIQLLCPPECWLTTISSQYFLYIVSFLILIENENVQKTWLKWPSRFILLISGLTGPSVTFLLLSYIFKANRTRFREDILRAGIVFFCGTIQGLAFVNTALNSRGELVNRFDTSRFNWVNILKTHLVDAFAGDYLLEYVANSYMVNSESIQNGCFLFFVFSSLYLLIKCCLQRQLHLHIISFMLLSIPSIILSLNMRSSPRAAFAPAIILVIVSLYESRFGNNRLLARGAATFLLSSIMLFGILSHRGKVYSSPTFPRWKDEVALWRQDNRHRLKIWPQFINDEHDWRIELFEKEK